MAKVKVKEKTEEELLMIKYKLYMATVNRMIREGEEAVKRLPRLKEVSKWDFEEWRKMQKL